jgi:hypothetical protein
VGQGDRVPRPIELIFTDRDHARIFAIVGVRGDLTLESLLVRPLEVAETLGTSLTDAGVLVFFLDDIGASLGLDSGQREPFAEDRREFVEG